MIYVMQVSFVATLLATSLGLGGKLFTLKQPSDFKTRSLTLIHFYGFIYLATVTVFYLLLLFVFDFFFADWVTFIILFLPLFVGIIKLYLAGKSIDRSAVCLSFLSLFFCMFLAGLPYWGDSAEVASYFPANNNHDIFPYLIRANFLSSNIDRLPSTLNGIPMKEFMLNISSKFSASYILAFFLTVSKNYGTIAGMGVVFVKGLLIHLLSFGLNHSRVNNFKSWSIAIIIALMPVVTWLQSWYYLSQLFFIYASILIISIDSELHSDNRDNYILSEAIIFILAIYFAFMYPVAIFPLLLMTLIASLLSKRKLSIFAKEGKIIKVLSLSCLFVLGINFFKYTEFNTHVTFDYFSVSYLPLFGQIWEHFSNFPTLWESKSIAFNDRLTGLLGDIICLLIIFVAIEKYVIHKYFTRVNFVFKALLIGWLFYQSIFFLSEANYRAFKFGSTFLTIFSLLLLSTFLVAAKDKMVRSIVPILLLFLSINFIPFFSLEWNNSFNREEVMLIDEMTGSKNKIIVSDLEKHYLNMMLILKMEKKDLYLLRNSYYVYELNSNDRLCSSADSQKVTVYYQANSPTANIIKAERTIGDNFYVSQLDRQSCYKWASEYPPIPENRIAPIYQGDKNLETLFEKILKKIWRS